MTALVMQGFIGEQPRIVPRYLDERAAQSAFNTRLDNGALAPWRRSAVENTDDAAIAVGWKTLFKHGADWLGWNTVVHAVPGPVAEDRLYYTGDGVPKLRHSSTDYNLALNPPASALSTAKSGSGSGDIITRLYTYTWVTGFGEESEPAPASDPIDWQSGETVTLSGFEDVSATQPGRNITKQRIYRSQTGQTGTFFYLIAERTASSADFVDDIAVDGFQEILPSTDYNAPPDGLEGLIELPNGMMAAFNGRKVYFCEPYQPHAWPEKYIITVSHDIMGLGAVGNTVVVMTTGQPSIIQGTSPETMQEVELEQNLPCINKRSIVDLGYAIAYASHEGLVAVDAAGGFSIATRNLFNRRDWESYNPASMVAAQLSGRYFAFYERTLSSGQLDKGGMIIDTSGEGYLIRTDTRASAVCYDLATSDLFYVDPETGYVKQFDANDASRRTLYWKSKRFTLPRPENMAAILVDAESDLSETEQSAYAAELAAIEAANNALIAAGPIGGAFNASLVNAYALNGDALEMPPSQSPDSVNVTVYADKEPLHTLTRTNQVVRLPGGKSAREWEVDVSANVQIDRILMATNVDELKVIA
ncbi:hypothetical protein [Oricola sp.]|uniref:hypothetical protein n=1 Tax=Oricola sp. TaxID=1979950 RepID=UPI003BAACBBF